MSTLPWARNPSPPDPSPDDCSDAERRAWRLAYRLAEADPGQAVTVWKSKGEWLVLRKGEQAPSRARLAGTMTAPLEPPVRYSIQHQDGRTTWHTLPAKGTS